MKLLNRNRFYSKSILLVFIATISFSIISICIGAEYENLPHDPFITAINPNKGPICGGTSVTITGTYLDSVTEVYFGETPGLSLVRISSTTIVVTSPASVVGAGTIDVIVVSKYEDEERRSEPSAHSKFEFISMEAEL